MGRLLNRSEASAWGEGAAVDLEEVVRDTMLAADQDQVLRQLATKRASQETAVDVRKHSSAARLSRRRRPRRKAKDKAAIARHYGDVGTSTW